MQAIRTKTREGRSERGATAVEYGLLVALIAAVIVVAAASFGGSVKDLFHSGCDRYQTNGAQHGTVDCH